jgi:hypothetical protein
MVIVFHSIERESKTLSDKILFFCAKQCSQPFWSTFIFLESVIYNKIRAKKGLKTYRTQLIFKESKRVFYPLSNKPLSLFLAVFG